MINYYEELKLDRNASAAELAAELLRLESVWHKREMSRPELAAEKLVQINDAKKIFASEAGKAQYDQELLDADKEAVPDDPEAARKAQFQKWYGDAVNYLNAGQMDLAKTAVERAASFGVDDNNAGFCYAASQIYRNNGDLSTALNYINRAIVTVPRDPENYIEKAFVLEAQYRQALQNRDDRAGGLLNQWRSVLEQSINMFSAASDQDGLARAYGILAFSLHFSSPQDERRAEDLARQAVEMGDSWGNAQRVLDDIAQKRAATEQAEREAQARRAEAERQRRERQMQLEQAEQQRQQRMNAMAEKDKKAGRLYIAGWFCVILSAALTFLSTRSTFVLVIKTAIVFGSVMLLNYADTYKNGYSTRFITAVSSGLGVAFCFMTATSAYTIMGYGARSASRTWVIFGIMLAAFFVLMFAAKNKGKKADQETRF